MSTTLSTIVPAAFANRTDALSRLLTASRDAIADYFTRRAAIAALREADDHALQDIGLERSQIEAAVNGLVVLPGAARM